MKKGIYFLVGVLSSALLLAGGFYYIYSSQVVPSETINELEKETLINKSISRITLDELEVISKKFSNETIVTFWKSESQTCLEEIPLLRAYAQNKNLDLIFVNLDTQTTVQDKGLFEKIKRLKIDKTYQLINDENTSDSIDFKSLSLFVKDRNIEIDTLKLPLNVVYRNGVYHTVFGSANIDNLYFINLDEYFK